MQASIIIPSLGRGESLKKCLDSVNQQTYRNFEVVLVTEEGELAPLRNKGAKKAKGEILIFIDDDVILTEGWLQAIIETFSSRAEVGGVSGPAVITDNYRINRDIFKYKKVKKLYDLLFLDGMEDFPGHITRSGAWTTGACNPDCNYDGDVDFLEACNMSFRRRAFEQVGGFDESFRGVGDWSEPDLAFRIWEKGWGLWFNSLARLEHQPSKSGAFGKRAKDAPNRLKNYLLFADRHVPPHWSHSLYKLFLRGYYATQSLKR